MLRYFVFIFLLIFLSINIYHYTISYEVIKLEKQNNRLTKEIFSELEYPLVFIDTDNKEVYKIDDQKEMDDLMSRREDYGIYIREYDCLNDY